MSIPADRSRLRLEGPAPTRARCSASSSEAAAERLTDDLLLEILPRVPAKSLCRFRCVSKHWLGLIDHPDHRKKLPQTLAGFFYSTTVTSSGPEKESCLQPPIHLISVSGSPCPLTSTSFAFLPNHMCVDVLDCCNGLFLCRWYGVSTQISDSSYIVCNPATEKWVVLPDSGQAIGNVFFTRLGFDPAQSSHFHVFKLLEDFDSWGSLAGVAVYSSETGGWVHKKERWNQHIMFRDSGWGNSGVTVFLNNHLYFVAICRGSQECLAAVDTEGETWTNFGVPGNGQIDGFIQRSQGRLHYANFYAVEENNVPRLAVYALENYESKEWTLKHITEASYLFRGTDVYLDCRFKWVGIHPGCNSIFFTASPDTTLMCYNMDHQQGKVICSLKNVKPPYLPYVPLYAELQSLQM